MMALRIEFGQAAHFAGGQCSMTAIICKVFNGFVVEGFSAFSWWRKTPIEV